MREKEREIEEGKEGEREQERHAEELMCYFI